MLSCRLQCLQVNMKAVGEESMETRWLASALLSAVTGRGILQIVRSLLAGKAEGLKYAQVTKSS